MEKIKNEDLVLCSGGGLFGLAASLVLSVINIIKVVSKIKRSLI